MSSRVVRGRGGARSSQGGGGSAAVSTPAARPTSRGRAPRTASASSERHTYTGDEDGVGEDVEKAAASMPLGMANILRHWLQTEGRAALGESSAGGLAAGASAAAPPPPRDRSVASTAESVPRRGGRPAGAKKYTNEEFEKMIEVANANIRLRQHLTEDEWWDHVAAELQQFDYNRKGDMVKSKIKDVADGKEKHRSGDTTGSDLHAKAKDLMAMLVTPAGLHPGAPATAEYAAKLEAAKREEILPFLAGKAGAVPSAAAAPAPMRIAVTPYTAATSGGGSAGWRYGSTVLAHGTSGGAGATSGAGALPSTGARLTVAPHPYAPSSSASAPVPAGGVRYQQVRGPPAVRAGAAEQSQFVRGGHATKLVYRPAPTPTVAAAAAAAPAASMAVAAASHMDDPQPWPEEALGYEYNDDDYRPEEVIPVLGEEDIDDDDDDGGESSRSRGRRERRHSHRSASSAPVSVPSSSPPSDEVERARVHAALLVLDRFAPKAAQQIRTVMKAVRNGTVEDLLQAHSDWYWPPDNVAPGATGSAASTSATTAAAAYVSPVRSRDAVAALQRKHIIDSVGRASVSSSPGRGLPARGAEGIDVVTTTSAADAAAAAALATSVADVSPAAIMAVHSAVPVAGVAPAAAASMAGTPSAVASGAEDGQERRQSKRARHGRSWD